MKYYHVLTLLPLLGVANCTPIASFPVTEREAIIDTMLAFTQSLDDKNKTLMRSVTTEDLIFDATLLADIGLGAPEPLQGHELVADSLLSILTMDTLHHLGNFRIDMNCNNANLTAFALAHYYRHLKDPRENPENKYEMENRYEAGVVKGKGGWKLEWLKILPIWQTGNFAVMGLGG